MNRFFRFTGRMLEVRSSWMVALCTFVWLSWAAWSHPLLLPDEGRYVGVAWIMLKSNELLVPLLDGLPFFHKPPLFYWITALAVELFGPNEWAARLASVLSGTLIVTLMHWFLKTWTTPRLAAVVAVVLAATPILFGASQYANLDMTVAAMISATVILLAAAVLRMEQGQPHRALLALAYVLAGLGFLSKGLIGVVLPAGVIFFWLVGRRQFASLLRLLWLPGIALFLAVSLPWMIYMQTRFEDFFDYYIVYQHFRRFLQTGFNNAQPAWFYVPVLLGLALPWSLQLRHLVRKAFWKQDAHSAISGLMLSWLLVILVFFSIPASKLVGYILPALAPLAYFTALPLARRIFPEAPEAVHAGTDARDSATRELSWHLLVSVTICLIAVIYLAFWPQRSTRDLAVQLRGEFKPQDTIFMVGYLRHDVPFYLNSGKPVAIVLDWRDPEILRRDTWRKEVLDAASFDPKLAEQLLINPDQFLPRVCGDASSNLWLIGDVEVLDQYPWMKNLKPYASWRHLQAWRIPAAQRPALCAGAPASDLK